MPVTISKHLCSFFRCVALLLMAVLLAACITTERGSLVSRADEQKALEDSLLLARSYIKHGKWEAAKRNLKVALEIDKSSAEIYEAMALVFQNTGELELAEKNYKQAIKLDREFSRARNNYAAFLYQQRRYREAIDHLQIVVADTLYAKRSSAYINLGRSQVQLEALEQAEQAFRRAHLMERNNLSLMYELADVYYRLQNYPESQKFYDAYRSRVKQQPAQALWLGLRLADKFGNRNSVSSYALALKNLYPTSKEYLEYKRVFGKDG